MRLSEEKVTKTQLADIAALYTTSRQALKTITVSFVEVASAVGLTVQRNYNERNGWLVTDWINILCHL